MDPTERLYELWQDPIDDPRLDEIPDSIRNHIVDVAAAILEEGRRPTPPLVEDVLEHLNIEVQPEWVTVTLMLHWRFRLDEVDPTDREALRRHLDQAPVVDHPWCHFLTGFLS